MNNTMADWVEEKTSADRLAPLTMAEMIETIDVVGEDITDEIEMLTALAAATTRTMSILASL